MRLRSGNGNAGLAADNDAVELLHLSTTVEQILAETSKWPADVVADLVNRITLAKHGELDEMREAIWTETALRRSAGLDSGKETLAPGPTVSARIRKIVGRQNHTDSTGKPKANTPTLENSLRPSVFNWADVPTTG